MPYGQHVVAVQPIESQDLSSNAGLTFTCQQTELKYHPDILGISYGQYDEFPSVETIILQYFKANNFLKLVSEGEHQGQSRPHILLGIS